MQTDGSTYTQKKIYWSLYFKTRQRAEQTANGELSAHRYQTNCCTHADLNRSMARMPLITCWSHGVLAAQELRKAVLCMSVILF
jgi:hypothetical protein